MYLSFQQHYCIYEQLLEFNTFSLGCHFSIYLFSPICLAILLYFSYVIIVLFPSDIFSWNLADFKGLVILAYKIKVRLISHLQIILRIFVQALALFISLKLNHHFPPQIDLPIYLLQSFLFFWIIHFFYLRILLGFDHLLSLLA